VGLDFEAGLAEETKGTPGGGDGVAAVVEAKNAVA